MAVYTVTKTPLSVIKHEKMLESAANPIVTMLSKQMAEAMLEMAELRAEIKDLKSGEEVK